MLYCFKSKAGADVIMTADGGDAVLRLLGREPAPQGILEAAALPGYIQQLEAGILAEEAEFQRRIDEAQAAGQPVPRREGVTLRQRAWPLRDLMQRSLKDNVSVVWGV